MPSETNQPPELDFAHVLFIDMVGYSLLKTDAQAQHSEELMETLRGTSEFRQAESRGHLIPLPTGDGVALVFSRDPLAPVRCALEVARALQQRPHLRIRTGIHSGLVYRVRDINTNQNVSGEGINTAQRVMDCGDAGHILLSEKTAETLEQLGNWSAFVQDLGEHEVKHGVRLRVFNLVKEGLGNPTLPQKLSTPQVALLYKRNAQPDITLLSLLETELSARGYKVFVDRHLAFGVKWAAEIDRQVRQSDAVIPLLSAASITSEMLAQEVWAAHDEAQKQNGKARLLPIRVNYTGPLSEELKDLLGDVQHAQWRGPEDNERLIAELIHALQHPEEEAQALTVENLEPVGGAMALDSKFWITRPTETEFRAALKRQDSIILIKGARQMGKTSLLARGLQQARDDGAKCIRTDFQKLNTAHLASIDTLFQALAGLIADQLDLDVLPDEVWNPRRGANVNFERYLRREVLSKIDVPIVWAMDEVDRLFTCDFGGDVFGLFRAWYNERSLDPSGPGGRMTLIIAYATEAHLFITDMNQSPFNVGTRLALEDFTLAQVADLNRRYGLPLQDDMEVARYYQLVSGQPYLVQRGLNEMVTRGTKITAFEAQADLDEGVFGDHLRRFLVLLVKDPDLCNVVRGVLQGQPCPTAESFYRLRSAGVLSGDSAQNARPRCQIYATYLSRHLL